jgi:hypothetical protein
MPTAKQKKFIDRFVAKVTSMGLEVKDPTSPIQDIRMADNNWLVIAINMPTTTSPELVKITARLPGTTWPNKQLTIAQFERINVRDLLAMDEYMRQTKDEIKELNRRIDTLRENLNASVASSFLNI